MRALVVVPRFVGKVGDSYSFPMGLSYISAALKKGGHEVQVLNLNHVDAPAAEATHDEVRRFDADALFCGGLSPHYRQVKTVLNAARLAKPNMPQVLGGGLLSSLPEPVLRGLQADVGVVGEGDITVMELADALAKKSALQDVRGIAFRDGDKFVRTPDRELIKQLDSLPMPDYEGLGMDMYLEMQKPLDNFLTAALDQPRQGPIIASRSCPYDCSFCYHPVGRTYRERSLDTVFQEIEYLISRFNINFVSVLDELLAVRRGRLEDFCKRMSKYKILWCCQLRVDIATPDIMDMLRDSGCYSISYGLESMSQTVLKGMHKHLKPAQIEHAMKVTYDAKIDMQGNFIFSDATETLETAAETLNWWKDHTEYGITLWPVHVLPGSLLWDVAVKKGAIPDPIALLDQDGDQRFWINTTQLSDEDYINRIVTPANFLQGTVSNPAEFLKLEKQPEPDRWRGDLYTVTLRCPHCNETVVYKNCSVGDISKSRVRVPCRACRRRLDFCVPLQPPQHLLPRCRNAIAEAGKGNITLAIRELVEVLKECPWHPEALAEACRLLHQFGQPAHAQSLAARAIFNCPLEPQANFEFVRACVAMGDLSGAKVYIKQAERLMQIAQRRGRPVRIPAQPAAAPKPEPALAR